MSCHNPGALARSHNRARHTHAVMPSGDGAPYHCPRQLENVACFHVRRFRVQPDSSVLCLYAYMQVQLLLQRTLVAAAQRLRGGSLPPTPASAALSLSASEPAAPSRSAITTRATPQSTPPESGHADGAGSAVAVRRSRLQRQAKPLAGLGVAGAIAALLRAVFARRLSARTIALGVLSSGWAVLFWWLHRNSSIRRVSSVAKPPSSVPFNSSVSTDAATVTRSTGTAGKERGGEADERQKRPPALRQLWNTSTACDNHENANRDEHDTGNTDTSQPSGHSSTRPRERTEDDRAAAVLSTPRWQAAIARRDARTFAMSPDFHTKLEDECDRVSTGTPSS
eukprot:COSAG05_NODE_188_length_14697_cov_11.861145_9_plen_339_part_00